MAYSGNVAATFLATSQTPWLRPQDPRLVQPATSLTELLQQDKRDAAQVAAGLAGAALNLGAQKDALQTELDAVAEQNRLTRRENRRATIARMAGSLPGLTPPSMYGMTGLGDSAGLSEVLARMSGPYYNLWSSGQAANANTPGITVPAG